VQGSEKSLGCWDLREFSVLRKELRVQGLKRVQGLGLWKELRMYISEKSSVCRDLRLV
jgi:hypothetical protein